MGDVRAIRTNHLERIDELHAFIDECKDGGAVSAFVVVQWPDGAWRSSVGGPLKIHSAVFAMETLKAELIDFQRDQNDYDGEFRDT